MVNAAVGYPAVPVPAYEVIETEAVSQIGFEVEFLGLGIPIVTPTGEVVRIAQVKDGGIDY